MYMYLTFSIFPIFNVAHMHAHTLHTYTHTHMCPESSPLFNTFFAVSCQFHTFLDPDHFHHLVLVMALQLSIHTVLLASILPTIPLHCAICQALHHLSYLLLVLPFYSDRNICVRVSPYAGAFYMYTLYLHLCVFTIFVRLLEFLIMLFI